MSTRRENMAYSSREIKDRVAIGDDCFRLEAREDGRYRLIPSPDEVIEEGSDVNKALLQLIEDRVVWLMNRAFSTVTANPFTISFESLDGITVTGIWNTSANRLEC
jgi:hypothetical protein